MTTTIMAMFILYCGTIPNSDYTYQRTACLKKLIACYEKDPVQNSVALDCIQKELERK